MTRRRRHGYRPGCGHGVVTVDEQERIDRLLDRITADRLDNLRDFVSAVARWSNASG